MILDFLFPKKCVSCKKFGDYLCPECFARLSFDAQDLCLYCRKGSILGFTHPKCIKRGRIDGAFSVIRYNRIAKKLIYTFKYKPYVAQLAEFLGELFYEGALQKEGLMSVLKTETVLVPIPLHPSKQRKRGYNHAEILAKELSKKLGIESQNLLTRVKDTKSQFGLDRDQRRVNMENAFEVSSKFKIQSSKLEKLNILLVDDILTTGSTILEAGELLKRNGASAVYGLTLARD